MADEAITLLRRRVSAWLRHPDPRGAQLIRWLQGYDLPSAQGREEPYQLVLRGLPIGRERHNAAAALAKRAAELLRREPEVKGIGKAPAALCYNLLGLCAALDYPDDLAEPLDEMFVRRRLRGDWQGHDLRRALLRALETNQTDARHKTMWNTMLEGRGNRFLGGTPEDGFHGILRCPSAGRGNPDVDAIGHALAVLARGYRRNPDRSLIFDDLLDQVRASYLRSNWARLLLETAHLHKWPSWARERLPEFFIDLGTVPDTNARSYYIPHSVFYLLKELQPIKLLAQLCGGRIRRVALPAEAASIIHQVSDEFERNRLGNPWGSEASVTEVDDYSLQMIECRFSVTDPRLAHAAQRARALLLTQKNVPFNQSAVAFAG
jgi:hypothetical protein